MGLDSAKPVSLSVDALVRHAGDSLSFFEADDAGTVNSPSQAWASDFGAGSVVRFSAVVMSLCLYDDASVIN